MVKKTAIPTEKLGMIDRVIQVVHVSEMSVLSEGGEYREVSTQDAVKCEDCGKIHILHDKPRDDAGNIRFFTLEGNLLVNGGGGLLGNASWDRYGVPVYHYCRDCFVSRINRWVNE